MNGFTNIDEIDIEQGSTYMGSLLDNCPTGGCMVLAERALIDNCPGGITTAPCPTSASYLAFKAAVQAHLSKVSSIWVVDEPYAKGLSPATVSAATNQLATDFPGVTLFLNLGRDDVARGSNMTGLRASDIPSAINWVGLDDYCDFSDVASNLSTIESFLTGTQRSVLFTDSSANSGAGNCAPGTSPTSDAGIAALQTSYLQLARHDPKLITMLAFNPWDVSGTVYDFPLTFDAQARIGDETARATYLGQCALSGC